MSGTEEPTRGEVKNEGEGAGAEERAWPEVPAMPEMPVFPEIPKRVEKVEAAKGSGLSGLSAGYALATEFLVYLGVCTALGWAVDRYVVGGGQLWTVVGAAFGLIGGGGRVFRRAVSMA
ncbi:MAG: AtpZ/AtpI family protein [Phycisphaerales bacterium]|nr:AtpZ/AtpI family protein [Phycisphaerales bacterium]